MHIKDLIIEGERNKLSLGRVAFWALFGVVLYQAFTTGRVDFSLIELSGLLLMYSAYKKWPKISDSEK